MATITQKVTSSVLLLVVLSTAQVGMCARILAVFPNPYLSHQLVYRVLMTELARRGHQMVVITTDPLNDPSLANYTEIDVSHLYVDHRKHFNFAGRRKDEVSGQVMSDLLLTYGAQNSDLLLSHGPVKKLISPQSNQHFDLVFVEWLSTPPLYAFAHRFSAPMIGISSLPAFGVGYDSVGNPVNPSYIPEMFTPYSDKIDFFERLGNLMYSIRTRYLFYNKLMPKHQAVARRHFGSSVPSILDMHFNVSMLFLTFNPCFHPPRPEVPAVVHISGLQLKSPQPLPQDLQKFLDSAPKGVIYFSLGSSVKSNQLDARTLQAFVDAFRELNGYHVLWKFESDNLPGQPDNDIPKVKVFLMQGGLQSTEEAVHSGVPVVCMPFFADQDYNVRRIVEKGIGIKLDLSEISKEMILQALRTILQDKRFYDNVRRLSFQMSDQPTSALERVVWWTEYVLRHKGAAHLRTAAVDMPLYKYLMLDILASFAVAALLVILLLWKVVKFLHGRLRTFEFCKLKQI